MNSIIIKLLHDTLKFYGALLLTLILCCLSLHVTPGAVTNMSPADSSLQASAATAASAYSVDDILAKMLITGNSYRTLSFDFYECDLSAAPEPLITKASVWVAQKPAPMMRIEKQVGYGAENAAWGAAFLAIHPELLVRNGVFNRETVSLLGDEIIGGRMALMIQAGPADTHTSQSGDQEYYWIDAATGIILRHDVYRGGSLKRSFILDHIELNREYRENIFNCTSGQVQLLCVAGKVDRITEGTGGRKVGATPSCVMVRSEPSTQRINPKLYQHLRVVTAQI